MSRSRIAIVLFALASLPARADDPIRPDPRLTPGAVRTTDLGEICRPGYARSVRHTSGKLKAFVYREYGINRRAGHYEIDHLIPLCLGGGDERKNLWPQSYDNRPWGADRKNELEAAICRKACDGEAPIEEAQREIAMDWIAAYQKYVGRR